MAVMIGCRSCGKTMPKDAKACQACGAENTAPTTPRSSWRGIVYGLVAVVVIAAFIRLLQPSPTSSSATDDGVSSSNGRNAAHDRIQKLRSAERNGLFTNINGDGCEVRQNIWRGLDKEDTSWWHLHCANGKQYLLSVKADATGSSSALDCSVAKAMKVDCTTWMGATGAGSPTGR